MSNADLRRHAAAGGGGVGGAGGGGPAPLLSVYLIRHGASQAQPSSSSSTSSGRNKQQQQQQQHVEIDDPLSPLGIEQAESLSLEFGKGAAATAGVDAVFVSPLSRALHTAVIIFGNTISSNSRSPRLQQLPTILVLPELREFSEDQKADQPLNERHRGVPFDQLRQQFPQSNILWPSNIGPQATWWEPHGDYAECVERIKTASQTLWDVSRSRGWKRIAVVAHENVFRIMVGVVKMENCGPLKCIMTQTGLGIRRKERVCCFPIDYANLLFETGVVIVVLGCSDITILRERIRSGLDRLVSSYSNSNSNKVAFLFAGNPRERKEFQTIVFEELEKLNLDNHDPIVKSILADDNSQTTVCNAEQTFGLIDCCVSWKRSTGAIQTTSPTVFNVLVTTSNWHMPRSLIIFRGVLSVLKPSWSSYITMNLEGFSQINDRNTYPSDSKHLSEGLHLATQALRHPVLWDQVRRECPNELRLVRALMCCSVERMAAPSLDICTQLRQTIKGPCDNSDQRRNELLAFLVQRYHDGDPVAHHPLRPRGSGVRVVGSYALHYAAEQGDLTLCSDLIYFFGARIDAPNSVGAWPIDYAARRGHHEVH